MRMALSGCCCLGCCRFCSFVFALQWHACIPFAVCAIFVKQLFEVCWFYYHVKNM